MGRITVFTAEGCSHCRRLKAQLRKRELPFVEISVTSYPDRRKDMLALADRLSTPQVFFNTRHVGGAVETAALLEEWESDIVKKGSKSKYKSVTARFMAEILVHPDPSNPRLAGPPPGPPPPPPQSGELREEDDDAANTNTNNGRCNKVTGKNCVSLPNGTRKETVVEVTETLKKIFPQNQDLPYNLTMYSNSFTGAQATQALLEHYAGLDSAEAAVEFGCYLQQDFGLLHHVANDHPFRDSSDYYYRLQCHHTPHILNSYRIWPSKKDEVVVVEERAPPPGGSVDTASERSLRLVHRLRRMMAIVESECAQRDGEDGLSDFANYLTDCVHYPLFEEAVCELQSIDLEALSSADHNTRMAFGINLYNLMIKYAFLKVGIPPSDSAKSRSAFYGGVSFDVGGYVFSLNEWEHGVLRGNSRAPFALSATFSKGDPRLAFASDRVDHRIHFGLNCGARSCPPVNRYTAADLDEELRIVAMAFCEDDDHVSVSVDKNSVQLSKIFDWYRADFVRDEKGSGNSDLLKVVATHLRGYRKQNLEQLLRASSASGGSSIKVTYKTYDWSAPVKNNLVFEPSRLKANRKSVSALFSSPPSSGASSNSSRG